jgi:hypothetical protein
VFNDERDDAHRIDCAVQEVDEGGVGSDGSLEKASDFEK